MNVNAHIHKTAVFQAVSNLHVEGFGANLLRSRCCISGLSLYVSVCVFQKLRNTWLGIDATCFKYVNVEVMKCLLHVTSTFRILKYTYLPVLW